MDDENYHKMCPFSLLPEGCIAIIISFTSPKDACRAAAISLGFKSAAESDNVWEWFLPPDYEEIVLRSSSLAAYSTKKELYFLLCETPLLLDGGKLSFRLSRSTGKKCYILCSRELQITWGGTTTNWTWTSLPESRFAEVAELVSARWLEISGIFQSEMLSPNTNYAAYLVFKLSDIHYGLDVSSRASVRLVRENGNETEGEDMFVYIAPPRPQIVIRRSRCVPDAINIDARLPRSRADGWLEVGLGEFFTDEGDDQFDVLIQFSETELLYWKKGLIVEGIEIRPNEACELL